MMPPDEIDEKAEEWFNSHFDKLRYWQDYSICFGHSEKMMEDGKQTGIKIRRPYVRLFSTGVTKLYRIVVLGEDLPKAEYTEEEEAKMDKEIQEAEERHERK